MNVAADFDVERRNDKNISFRVDGFPPPRTDSESGRAYGKRQGGGVGARGEEISTEL